MATDRTIIPAQGSGGDTNVPVASKDDASGLKHQQVVVETMVSTTPTPVSASAPLPISDAGGSITVDGTVTATGPLTDTQLRASAVPVSGTVTTSPPSNASTNIAQIAGATALTGHGVATGALRVELPTDGTGIVGLAAGANAIGSVTANIGTVGTLATAARQPALGTVGVPSADFITVQGNASGTPIPVSGTFSASGTTDLTATGNITASGQSVSITTLNGMSVCEIDVSGTWTHNLLSQGTIDGTNWFGIYTPYAADPAGSTVDKNGNQILANGRYQVNVAGYAGVRITCTITASGTAVVALRASAASGVNYNLATVGNTPVDTNSGNKSAGTQRVVIATDQPNLTSPLNVILTPGSSLAGKVGIDQTTPGTTNLVALAANQSVNQAQVAGTAVDTNSGNKSAGTQRVVIATDQPNLTSALNVALAANQSVNAAQINGVTPLMGTGVTGTGSLRVTIATDQVQLTNALKVDPSGVTSPVSLASVPSHAVTNAGTFAVQAATELATGLTTFSNTALSSTKTAVKAGAGKVYGWMIHNPSAATTFLQVWNVAIGSITVGTTAPTYVLAIPAGASANVMSERGITHSTEINVAATTTATGSSAPATALVVGIFYI